MSTYYFLACDKCKEMTDAASLTVGGYSLTGPHTLVPFIITHHPCGAVRIVSEREDVEYKKWTAGNVDEMYRRDRDASSA
jgi:hypothetical protein